MGKLADFCPPNHLKAVLYRRYITFKRSWKSVVVSMVGTLILTALGIAVYWMMVGMNSIKDAPITFNSYTQDRRDIVLIGDTSGSIATNIIKKLKENFINQTGKQPVFRNYESIDQMQEIFYNLQKKKQFQMKIPFGLDFTKDPVEIIVFYNATTNDEVNYPNELEVYAFVLVGQVLWELQYNNETKINKNNLIYKNNNKFNIKKNNLIYKNNNKFNIKKNNLIYKNNNKFNINKNNKINTNIDNLINTNNNNKINTNIDNLININNNNKVNTNIDNLINTNNNNKVNINIDNSINTNNNNKINKKNLIDSDDDDLINSDDDVDDDLIDSNNDDYINSGDLLKVKNDLPFVKKSLIYLNDDSQYSDIDFNFIRMNKNGISGFFEALCPMFLVFGLLTIVMLILATPITDIRGEVRTYMVQCTLKIFPYWFGAFVIDLAIWVVITTIVWGLFNLGWIKPLHDNLFSFWWILVFQGPSFILFLYAFSFCFKNPDSATRQIFIILLIINFIVLMITLILHTHPIWLNWIWSIFPTISIQQGIFDIMKHTGMSKMSFHEYWHDQSIQPFFIMQWVDIVLYGAILTIIEASRKSIEKAAAKHSFSSYSDYFHQLKNKNQQSPETQKMEDDVHNSHDWAVRIEDVSRLFINTAGKPIPAVNNVCLGIKQGSCFGFLGANGAGKTTLMRMITGMLPPSSGSIEIFKVPFDEIKDKTVLSICPQFNSHLFNELTPREHFKIYAWLFQKDPQEANTLTNSLISELDLIDFQNIPIRELSAGDVRKLAIALSFFGPSKLLLLDEPTAFLDPVACNCVQEMILEHKGEKTFMLCTHILNEAELLCDVISIMVRGNVYTVGTPQYLTQKFGTEYKIDIMLDDASQESSSKIDAFLNSQLPFAQLTIDRPASRIYSVPASKIQLCDLFLLLEKGQKEHNGYKYFTCSTSSLERVFMEIVRISQLQDAQNSQNSKSDMNSVVKKLNENASVNENENRDDIHLNIGDHENDNENENEMDDIP